MAQIIINIPDGVLSRVIDGICNALGYAQYVVQHPGVTKAQFAKAMLIRWIKRTVIESEVDIARSTTAVNSETEVGAIDIN